MWEQFSITGCKIQWEPACLTAGTSGQPGTPTQRISLDGIWFYDDPDSPDPTSVTEADFVNRKSTRFKDPNRPWKHFLDLKAYSAQQNVPWQDTKDFNPSQENTLTKGSTILRFFGECPYEVPKYFQMHGFLIITYYIKFRGQALYS